MSVTRVRVGCYGLRCQAEEQTLLTDSGHGYSQRSGVCESHMQTVQFANKLAQTSLMYVVSCETNDRALVDVKGRFD